MKNDVFISHSSADRNIADMICAELENNNINCWIAHRNIEPGTDWAEAINNAIKNSTVMVAMFSKDSNNSVQVPRELNLALNNKVIIIPFKIDDTTPTGSIEYYLSDTHWLIAANGDMSTNICILKDTILPLLPHKKVPNILRPAGDL